MTAEQAQATLGEFAASVESDRKALSAVQRAMKDCNGFIIQEFSSDSILVREYVSSSGVVFGIAWNGLTHPDLAQLLGSYAAEYREALQQTPRINEDIQAIASAVLEMLKPHIACIVMASTTRRILNPVRACERFIIYALHGACA